MFPNNYIISPVQVKNVFSYSTLAGVHSIRYDLIIIGQSVFILFEIYANNSFGILLPPSPIKKNSPIQSNPVFFLVLSKKCKRYKFLQIFCLSFSSKYQLSHFKILQIFGANLSGKRKVVEKKKTAKEKLAVPLAERKFLQILEIL